MMKESSMRQSKPSQQPGQFIQLNLNSSDTMVGKKMRSPTSNSKIKIPTSASDPQGAKYEIDLEIKKLIKAYSRQGSQNVLTNNEFIDLANDLMSTVEYPQLKQGQIKVIFTAIDANNDMTVSAGELEQIIKNNRVK